MTFDPSKAPVAELRERNAMAVWKVGDRARVNWPGWWRHGQEGEVVKVNRVTIRIYISDDGDFVSGGKVWFVKVKDA